ncbi:hypothetical protein [Halobacteriovorax sp.]|uniref:hypothetical protein n=1 Tax=Halobacteriovorax sp. TaxID=2020862 RepID=UPI00356A7779
MDLLKKSAIVLILGLSSAFAGIEQAPPSFSSSGKRAVWVDFIKAKYDLTFDINNKKASAVSTIEFELAEKGYPIFDLDIGPRSVSIDGVRYSQSEIKTPDRESKVRIIKKELLPGSYTLKIENNIVNGIKFRRKDVSAAFFMSDLKDRNFLEKYIPSNYEYDQYKIELSLKVLGARKSHRLFTNGSLVQKSDNYYKYSYPEYFTSSSLFFHFVPENKFKVISYTYESKLSNGSHFPVTLYSKTNRFNKKMKKEVDSVLRELERDYGPWPHPQLILYGDGEWKGGMEYAGAATSAFYSIGHELQHSYFARSVMPANGNAGWIDEAVASWRDNYLKSAKNNSKSNDLIPVGRSRNRRSGANLANHSPYRRVTPKMSYTNGSDFIFYLDSLFSRVPGKSVKKFLKIYYQNRKYTTISNNDFKLDLENYYGETLDLSFNKYIFGNSSKDKSIISEDDHYHPVLSKQELLDLI